MESKDVKKNNMCYCKYHGKCYRFFKVSDGLPKYAVGAKLYGFTRDDAAYGLVFEKEGVLHVMYKSELEFNDQYTVLGAGLVVGDTVCNNVVDSPAREEVDASFVGNSISHLEYVPFDETSISKLEDNTKVFYKTINSEALFIGGFDEHKVHLILPTGITILISYYIFLMYYLFEDGSPCGVKVSPPDNDLLEQGKDYVESWNKYIEYLDCYHKNDVCMPKVKNSGVISPGHKYGDNEEKSFDDKKEIEMAKLWIESLSPEVFRFVMLKYLYRERSYSVVDIYRLENFINK